MKLPGLILTLAALSALSACGSNEENEASTAELTAGEQTGEIAALPAGAPAGVSAGVPTDVPASTDAQGAAQAPTPEAAPPPAAVAASGPPDSYLICSSCHAVEPGRNGIGPTLAGVYGKKAASVPGFSYSDALKKADITWTDAALDRWLEAPMKMVPGSRMVFGGIADAAKRKELIGYMKTL